MNFYRTHVLIGMDDSALQAGVKDFVAALRTELAKHSLDGEVGILETGPLGYFGKGICFVVYPDNVTYVNVTVDDLPELVSEHFLKGRPLSRLVMNAPVGRQYDFAYGKRIVLENSGIIDPENIDEYIGVGGYEGLEKILTAMKPMDVVDEVKKSGLRGRGGAGFPTGLKWSFTAPIEATQKYVVVNADEGEPGTFKDRLIMEGDPHKLLEGIMIASYAVGASKAWIYIRGEYSLSIERMQKAIDAAREYGLLGDNILGTGFQLDVELKIGAGAYVCGEETALIESMEGNRGVPRMKPPFPGVRGAWQHPTVVNNVETLANVPAIIKKGAEWFKSVGPEKSPGTKVYTILGDVEMPGLTEVEMGTTLRTIINVYGGGMKDGKKFKGALVGGAAGVFLSDALLNVKMDYASLAEYAAVLGSGAILVMGEDVSMVEMLHSILRFFRHESCGKCSPCRLGTERLFRLSKKIVKGEGTQDDLDQMILLSEVMQKSAFCPLGQSPIMPVKSAIENFRDEFQARVK
jgi:NADH-quinone oxidoreductase subunit F